MSTAKKIKLIIMGRGTTEGLHLYGIRLDPALMIRIEEAVSGPRYLSVARLIQLGLAELDKQKSPATIDAGEIQKK